MLAGKRALLKSLWAGAGLLIGLAPGWAANGREPVRLQEVVAVRHETVFLSDLLPSDATAALRMAGAAIELCRAPQPGSIRILGSEEIARRMAGASDLLRGLVVPPRITIRSYGWPIGKEPIRQAIADYLGSRGWKRDVLATAKVEWPETLAANEENFRLQVTGSEWNSHLQTLLARLRCSNHSACGSFLVRLFLPPGVEAPQRLGSEIAQESNRFESAVKAAPSGPPLAERGKSATLLLQGENVRFSVPVYCIDTGALKQWIRVVDSRHRLFRAEVVGAGLLRAAL